MPEEGAVCAGEGAPTEKNRADRASGVRVVNADEATGGGFVDGHFRDDGDAHVRADHGEETERVAPFKNDAAVEAGAVAGGDISFAEAVSIAEKKKRIQTQIGETKRGSTSELVLFGKRGEEAFRKEVERFEVVASNGQRQNGESELQARLTELIELRRKQWLKKRRMLRQRMPDVRWVTTRIR